MQGSPTRRTHALHRASRAPARSPSDSSMDRTCRRGRHGIQGVDRGSPNRLRRRPREPQSRRRQRSRPASIEQLIQALDGVRIEQTRPNEAPAMMNAGMPGTMPAGGAASAPGAGNFNMPPFGTNGQSSPQGIIDTIEAISQDPGGSMGGMQQLLGMMYISDPSALPKLQGLSQSADLFDTGSELPVITEQTATTAIAKAPGAQLGPHQGRRQGYIDVNTLDLMEENSTSRTRLNRPDGLHSNEFARQLRQHLAGGRAHRGPPRGPLRLRPVVSVRVCRSKQVAADDVALEHPELRTLQRAVTNASRRSSSPREDLQQVEVDLPWLVRSRTGSSRCVARLLCGQPPVDVNSKSQHRRSAVIDLLDARSSSRPMSRIDANGVIASATGIMPGCSHHRDPRAPPTREGPRGRARAW